MKVKNVFSEHTIIAWVMSAAIIPMLLLAFFAYKNAKTMLETTISHVLLTEIKKKVGEIDNNIATKKLNLLQFCGLPELKNTLESSEINGRIDSIEPQKMIQFSNYLNYITPRIGVTNFWLISMDGKTIYTLHNGQFIGEILSKDNRSHQDLYKSFDGARILRIPYLYPSFHANGLNIYLSNVITDNHRAKAVLIMQLDPFDIKKVVLSNFGYTKYDHTTMGMLVDSKPTIVLSTLSAQQISDEETYNPRYVRESNALLLNSIEGDMPQKPITASLNNVQLLKIYSYVPQLNMGMIIAYDRTDVYQKIRWLQINMIVITLIDLLIVVMIVLWIAGSLREAHRKSERLLENILPKFVIDELKEKKLFAAREVDNISIIFTDFVNFTPFCSSKSPEEVVVILDELFSIFDNLCDRYQLEKIKTIGDAYMAVAGLIVPDKNHAAKAVNMGLDAIEAVNVYNLKHHTDFSIRIGIDSGNVITGIIGKKKFSYDLWGNAVNYASRMESSGIADAVQISSQTYLALTDKENYLFTRREHVEVKGLGIVDTYLVSRD